MPVGITPGVACSVCADGFFEQFGKCVACPSQVSASVGELFGISSVLIIVCTVLYVMRRLLPVDVIKLGLSMLQVRCRSEVMQPSGRTFPF